MNLYSDLKECAFKEDLEQSYRWVQQMRPNHLQLSFYAIEVEKVVCAAKILQ